MARIEFSNSKNITVAKIFEDWFVMWNINNPDIPIIEYKGNRYISILDAINPTPVHYSVWFNKDKNYYILRLYYLNHLDVNEVNMLISNLNIIRIESTYITDDEGEVTDNYIAVDIKVTLDTPNGDIPDVNDKPIF